MSASARGGRRVVVVSQRRLRKSPAYAALYEFEDFVLSVEDAVLVEIKDSIGDLRFDVGRYSYQAMRRVGLSHDASARFAPTLTRIDLPDDVDLVLAILTNVYDLSALQQIKGIDRTTVLCWVSETWPTDLLNGPAKFEPFGLLDHVFVGLGCAAEPLSDLVGSEVIHLPLGIDTSRFANHWSDERSGAVVNIGRRDESVHRALERESTRSGWPYVVDRRASNRPIADHRAHRDGLAELLGRSSYFIVNHAKFDLRDVVGSNREVSGRLFEALASGSLPIGSSGLVDVDVDGRELCYPVSADDATGFVDAIRVLSRDPEEVERRRRLGYQSAARSHDWAHRWSAMLGRAGLPLTASHQARIDALSLSSGSSPVD